MKRLLPMSFLIGLCACGTRMFTPTPPAPATVVVPATVPPSAIPLPATQPIATNTQAPTTTPADLKAIATNAIPEVANVSMQQLAQLLKIEVTRIKVISVEERDFPDGCYGIPRVGFMCTQVITTGVGVTLEADGKRYVFHADSRGLAARLNPKLSAPIPP